MGSFYTLLNIEVDCLSQTLTLKFEIIVIPFWVAWDVDFNRLAAYICIKVSYFSGIILMFYILTRGRGGFAYKEK